jgi:hypothetical protein
MEQNNGQTNMEYKALAILGIISGLLLILCIYLGIKQSKYIKKVLELKMQLGESKAQYTKQFFALKTELTQAEKSLNDATKPDILDDLEQKIGSLTENSKRLSLLLDSTKSYLNETMSNAIDIKLSFFERELLVGSPAELKKHIVDSQLAQRKLYEDTLAVTIFYGHWDTGYTDSYYHSQPYREDVKYKVDKTKNQLILNSLEQWTNTQLLITAFNLGCEKIINSVKNQSLERSIKRIQVLARKLDKKYIQESVHITAMAYETLIQGLIAGGGRGCRYNGLLQAYDGDKKLPGEEKAIWTTDINLTISDEYIEAKIYELRLQYEYVVLLAEEKERLKEEKLVAAELKKQQETAQQEEDDINNQLSTLSNGIDAESEELRETIKLLKDRLAQVVADKERAISMAQITRSGFVYVISNVGTMGKDILKIGMTRRIDPMERVRELGDASVPFQFDVHTIIKTDDAPSLEKMLHERFKNKRVNLMNNRKEFFEVPLLEVKNAISELYSAEFEFKEEACADDFNNSTAIKLDRNSY